MLVPADAPDQEPETELLRTARRAPAPGGGLFAIGPYAVVRALVRAPGAFFAEARGPHREAVLLQLAALRPIRAERERPARVAVERRLARDTAHLLSEHGAPVQAHGAVDQPGGARVVFWALPWRPEAERLGRSRLHVEGAEHLLLVARALAQRVARRHLLGGLEPLLSEDLVLTHRDGAELVGVPVAVPPEWCAEDTPPPRWAPEEAASPTRAGDLWRLGRTLTALGGVFETVPSGYARLVRRLSSPDPADRPPRATEAVVELEAMHEELGRGLPLVPLETAPTVSLEALPADALSALMARALGRTEETEPPTLLDVPAVDPTAAPTAGAGPTLVLPEAPALAAPPKPRRWYVWGGIAALLAFAGILVGARAVGLGGPSMRRVEVDHRVEVEAAPPGAVLVAERDGRVLGPAPQRFWIGPGPDVTVLVTAPGVEPRRVVLPARGQLRVELDPLPADVAPCALDLPDADRGRLEPVGASWVGPGRLRVPGAAVIRSRGGADVAGAWLLRCPGLGGEGEIDLARPRLRQVSVAVEAGGARTELRHRGAFRWLAVGDEQRWIPADLPVLLTAP